MHKLPEMDLGAMGSLCKPCQTRQRGNPRKTWWDGFKTMEGYEEMEDKVQVATS